MKSKKAMEMSMNTIIIAVIALLILTIMIFLIAKNTKGINRGLNCPSYGGKCELGACESSMDVITHYKGNLCDNAESCCSIVPNKGKTVELVGGKEVVQARLG